MKKFPSNLALLAVAAGCVGQAFATGFYGPREYLASGGKNLTASPEFYWELETKRLARNYHPTEKPMVVARDPNETGVATQAPMMKATADADDQDFAEALKTGAIKPADTAKATQQQDDARKFIRRIDRGAAARGGDDIPQRPPRRFDLGAAVSPGRHERGAGGRERFTDRRVQHRRQPAGSRAKN